MSKKNITFLFFLTLVFLLSGLKNRVVKEVLPEQINSYEFYVKKCIETLMEHGTDRYGKVHAPILVSILEVESLTCPSDPKRLDEYFRVTRRDRRNPAGANLLPDQPLLETMRLLSQATGNKEFARFAKKYSSYYLNNLVDDKGFFWWGWHRHYDVFQDSLKGHNGNHHEIHAIHEINWESLWQVNRKAVIKEIEAIWQWHVIKKQTGEINRHGDGEKGCDFSMSAGAYIEAFAFMYKKTQEKTWLDRAKLLADYYWERRNPETNLFPERPNAGNDRFDGSSFVTPITGLYCHSLLKAYELTGEISFRKYAMAHLKAYAKYGFDENSGKFWGALQMDGTPIPGPRVFTDNVDSSEGYEASQPRGYLDLWEPYIAGYQYPVYTAQVYAYAYDVTGEEVFLKTAKRFATWIKNTPVGADEFENAWYREYTRGPGQEGTYAGKYGRTISFFLHLYMLTGENQYLEQARKFADTSIDKLYHNGLFRGHPAKPYYEAIDGVGYLLYALLQIDEVLNNPEKTVLNKKIILENKKVEIPAENW